jgi:phospholipase/lecithinase/hemolysin
VQTVQLSLKIYNNIKEIHMRTLACVITLLAIHFLAAGAVHARGFDEIIAFGESSTDTGNVALAQCSQLPPYLPGAGFPVFWAPCTPLDSSTSMPGYFDGRLSNGPLWVEFLADAFGVDRPRPSTDSGTNYAHAGAKIGPDATTEPDAEFNLRVNLYPDNPVLNTDGPCNNTIYQAGELVCGSEVPHIITQIKQYLYDRGGLGFNNNQLVVIWGGANDLRDIGRDPAGPEAAIANIVNNLATAVSTAAAGGAKHIAVLNQLNAARAPITQALCGGDPLCLGQIEAAVQGFNAALRSALKELQLALREQGSRARIHYVDVYSAGEVAVELSELFGRPFINTTEPALVPDPNPQSQLPLAKAIPDDAEDYLFWDVIHPTEKAYRITAYRVCKTLDRKIRRFEPQCSKILTNN